MVLAVINIDEKTNRVLNIVKAKFGLKDKSQAISLVVNEYEQNVLEPELRPEYVKKALRIHSQPSVKVGSVEKLRKRYEN